MDSDQAKAMFSPSQNVAFERAVKNIVKHAKRSLLDVVDVVKSTRVPDPKTDPQIHAALDMIIKRVHNDVSVIESQLLSIFAIHQAGGVIPPFGRTEEERAGYAQTHR